MNRTARRARVFACLAALAVSVATSARSEEPSPRADYLTVITLARTGDRRRAIEAVIEGPGKLIGELVANLLDDSRCTQACRQAGVLLHTEAAFLCRQWGHADLEKAHFAAAEALTTRTRGDRRAAVDDAFERTWRLAVARRHQEWAAHARALQIYDALLKQHPDDPDALLARGTLAEVLHTGYQDAPDRRRLVAADAAQRDYERALRVRPGFAEARLRLGRVLGLIGRSKATRAADARRELRRVLDEAPSDPIRAYAHLFLGQVEEMESHLAAATLEYRAALSADPRLQPAQLALCHALQKSGHSAEAAAVLLDGLRATADGDVHGWYGYHTTALQSYRASMDRLWEEVRK
jgi:tetratricopeptide (TPR) repeat protein